jgi:uncharacterized protein DUF6969
MPSNGHSRPADEALSRAPGREIRAAGAIVDFTRLDRAELNAMAAAASEVLECQRALAASGVDPLRLALAGSEPLREWDHYPEGDVYDPETHAQYFYHVHPPAERAPGEYGHFHTFLRPRGMPPGTRPLMLPELAIADAPAAPAGPALQQPNQGAGNDDLSHLMAIAVDPRGAPLRLFTTNRWVTGEAWYAASDAVGMLDRFAIGSAGPSALLNRWLTALFRLFRPQMAALLYARDDAVMAWRRRHRGKVHVFEDRRLEITSILDIDVDDQLRCVELALRRTAGSDRVPQPEVVGSGLIAR